MNKRLSRVVVAGGMMVSASLALAAGPVAGGELELLSQPLEQLLTHRVITASRREEEIRDAPGVISIVTREQIRRYGARDLADVIELAPGTFTLGTYLFPVNVVALRGDLSGQYNTHVLLLVNGRPVWEGQNSGTELALLRAFPIDSIDRVEVVRGPGSVLHGTSAFAGVINVITHNGGEPDNDVIAGVGDDGAHLAGLNYAGTLAEWRLTFNLQHLRDDGFAYRAYDERGDAFLRTYDQDNTGVHIYAERPHWQLQFIAGESALGHIGTLPIATFFRDDAELHSKRYQADIGYRHELGAYTRLKLNLSYNGLRNDYVNPGPQPSYMDAQDYGLEAVLDHQFDQGRQVLAGANLLRLAGDSGGTLSTTGARVVIVPSYLEHWARAFLEYSDWLRRDLRLVLGVQANRPEGQEAHLSKRVSANYLLNAHWTLKAQYAEAYRSASMLEKSIALTGVVVGNPELKPEQSKTTDLELRYSSDQAVVALNFFRASSTDLIDRIPDPALGATYINQGRIRYRGAELELAWSLDALGLPGLTLDGSWVHQRNQKGGVDNFTAMPENVIKLGLQGGWGDAWEFGGHLLSARDWGRLANAAVRNPDPGNITNVRAQLRYQATPRLSVRFTVENLLAERMFVPEVARGRMNTLPYYEGGRTLRLALAWRL